VILKSSVIFKSPLSFAITVTETLFSAIYNPEITPLLEIFNSSVCVELNEYVNVSPSISAKKLVIS
jgi:hypothetical protein